MKNALQRMAAKAPLAGALVQRLRALAAWPKRSDAERLEELRRYVGKLCRIEPLFVAEDRQGFVAAAAGAPWHAMEQHCRELLQAQEASTFYLRRFCLCCNEMMPMLVDHQFGSVDSEGRRVPNWRERLVCRGCGMNNRQRLVAKLVQQAALQYERPRIYLMEQVTPIFSWVRGLDSAEVQGSEYLGHAYAGGDVVKGIRHEDVMQLSYADASFDMIVSNDVLEHIPEPAAAFRECFRVLKPGGTMLATFPFHTGSDQTAVRARLVGQAVDHLLLPHYHGNPVSADGSLVFQDFGWDFLDVMRAAGFSPVQCECYSSDAHGYLGPPLLVFRLRKP